MSSEAQEQERREQCRREVLRYCAIRSVLAFKAETIRNMLRREFNFTIEEITAALEFENGAGRLQIEKHGQGVTKFYRVTSTGILFHEDQP